LSLAVVATLLSSKQILGFGIGPITPELHQTLPHILDHFTASSSVVVSSLTEVSDGIVARYQDALKTDALRTQVATGVILAVTGDAIAQKANGADSYDTKRAGSFVAFDACYRAVQHYLYPPMIALCQGSLLGALVPSQTLAAALEQALVSQLLIIPLLYYPTFYAITGFVQGLTVEATVDRAKTAFWPLMRRNWAFWIPIQFLVFGCVHNEAEQISILIAAGLIWTVILSLAAGQATPSIKENILQTSSCVLYLSSSQHGSLKICNSLAASLVVLLVLVLLRILLLTPSMRLLLKYYYSEIWSGSDWTVQ